MTEAQWLAGTNPEKMLAFVLAEEPIWPLRLLRLFARRQKPPNARKLRLFICACVRQGWDLLGDEMREQAMRLAELYADELAIRDQVALACEAARMAPPMVAGKRGAANLHALSILLMYLHHSVDRTQTEFHACYSWVAELLPNPPALIRHIFGNPFTPYPAPVSWPAVVVGLANSLYAGQDCAPMLADALEEAGHADLAEHMRSEQVHPKGCWVLDLILGKS